MKPPSKFGVASIALLAALALSTGCATLGRHDALPPGTHGSFGDWKVRDAVAVRREEGMTLVFANLRFDRRQWMDDSTLTPDDLGLFLGNANDYAPRIELALDTSYRLVAHRLTYGNHGTVWRDAAGHEDALTITTREADRVAGTLRLDLPERRAIIDFDLSLLAFGPLTRPGMSLADDGGEPGRFLLAKSRAIWEGDLDGALAHLSPEEYSSAVGHWNYSSGDGIGIDYEPGDLGNSGSSFFMLKQRMNTPFVERIIGGSMDGNTAWVDFSGSDGVIGHDDVSGTAVMKRDRKGRWSVDRVLTQEIATPEDDELDALEREERENQ